MIIEIGDEVVLYKLQTYGSIKPIKSGYVYAVSKNAVQIRFKFLGIFEYKRWCKINTYEEKVEKIKNVYETYKF